MNKSILLFCLFASSSFLSAKDLKVVLNTEGGPDGSNYDHAVWANARLVKAGGSSVWLDQLSYEYAVTGWGNPVKNTNINGQPIRIGGKTYEHGVLCHANGTLVYPLKEKYVRFEAEVGISYIERPKFSTSYARKAYYPYQRIFNVGFRDFMFYRFAD